MLVLELYNIGPVLWLCIAVLLWNVVCLVTNFPIPFLLDFKIQVRKLRTKTIKSKGVSSLLTL